MSNDNEQDKLNEAEHGGLSAMLAEVLAEYRKSLFTAIPAIVVSYDGATKRANLQPTPLTLFKDGTSGALPILPNVPVIMPSGGGYYVSVPLKKGDTVLVCFCQRGIKNFKKTYAEAAPSGGVLDINSPVAIAGFGSLAVTPSTGLSLQKEDGTVKVEVLEDNIKIEAPIKVDVIVGGSGGATFNADGSVDFANGASSPVDGDFITASGISLNNHVHPFTTTSGAPDGEHTGTTDAGQ